ncbi:MAG: hypothetical protein ABMA13_05545 [Chthoniobacteraceae bacterium]
MVIRASITILAENAWTRVLWHLAELRMPSALSNRRQSVAQTMVLVAVESMYSCGSSSDQINQLMKPEEIREIAHEIAKALDHPSAYPWWLVVLLAILLAGIVFTLRYLAEKAKGVATKEDIATLTGKVESIKHEYSEKLTILAGDVDYRNIAREKRLTTHQKAFALLYELRQIVPNQGELIDYKLLERKFRLWWFKNSLFLAPAARESFLKAVEMVGERWRLQRTFEMSPASVEVEQLTRATNQTDKAITDARIAIVEGVSLPTHLEK